MENGGSIVLLCFVFVKLPKATGHQLKLVSKSKAYTPLLAFEAGLLGELYHAHWSKVIKFCLTPG